MEREKTALEPSRSAKKREAKAVEDLARQLVELSEAEATRLPASSVVAAEIELARETHAHGARRRQIKHLANILRRREEEIETLRAFLEGRHEQQLEENKLFHELEDLREKLCDPERFTAALEELASAFPDIDRNAITRLARSVQTTGDRKAYREIFRQLRKSLER